MFVTGARRQRQEPGPAGKQLESVSKSFKTSGLPADRATLPGQHFIGQAHLNQIANFLLDEDPCLNLVANARRSV